MSEHRPRLNLADVLKTFVEKKLSEMHVALPGRVVSYSASDQTADIELGFLRVNHQKGQRQTEEFPILPNVPVQFPRGGGYAITYPLNQDDPVMVVFNDHSLDRWRDSGSVTDPGDTRRGSLAGAVCIAGIGPESEALSSASDTDMRVGKDSGAHIIVKSDGDVDIKSESGQKVNLASATNAMSRADHCNKEHANIKTALDTVATAAGTTHAYTPSDVDADDVKGS